MAQPIRRKKKHIEHVKGTGIGISTCNECPFMLTQNGVSVCNASDIVLGTDGIIKVPEWCGNKKNDEE